VHAEAVQSRIDRVAGGDIAHSGVSESSVARLQFCHKLVDFFLKRLRLFASKDLLSSSLGPTFPIHPLHSRIEMLGFNEPADLVENFRTFVESQIHFVIPIGVEVSPTVMNAAQ